MFEHLVGSSVDLPSNINVTIERLRHTHYVANEHDLASNYLHLTSQLPLMADALLLLAITVYLMDSTYATICCGSIRMTM